MSFINKENAQQQVNQEFKKLSLFVTIVDKGNAEAIISLMESVGCSLQYVQSGQGTAQKEILDIFGLENNDKEVVFSLTRSELIPQIKAELEAFFVSNKRNKGVGFSIPFRSIIGLKAYHFISNDL